MNIAQLKEFIADVNKSYNHFWDRYPDSHEYLLQVVQQHEEKYALSNLYQPPLPKQQKNDVEKKLKESLNNERFKDYSEIESELCKETTEQILKSVAMLDKAIGDCERKTIYYSALKGVYLGLLSHNDFQRLDMSKSHKSFLVRLGKLVQEYPRLRHCELPLNFFHRNLSKIKEICITSGEFWKSM